MLPGADTPGSFIACWANNGNSASVLYDQGRFQRSSVKSRENGGSLFRKVPVVRHRSEQVFQKDLGGNDAAVFVFSNAEGCDHDQLQGL